MTERAIGTPLSMHDPRALGPWSLKSRLGAGGMGVVFHATGPGGEAAVKVIRPGLLDAPATRDRFSREVSILRFVNDDHICRFLDADLTSEPVWLAMEYLAGDSLKDLVTQGGPLPAEQWWSLAAGLAQALDVLATHRITHRDLKPGNIIMTERGPVLIDFGIARPEDATQLTGTGLVTGSPAWLSPEQADLGPTGPPTDIFSFGSLLAYAGTGRPPFGEGTSVAVLMSILKRPPDLAGIDPVRTALLTQMLDKDPQRRPTAGQVRDLAKALLAGADIITLLGGGREAPTVAEDPLPPTPPGPTPPAPLPSTGGTTAQDLQPVPAAAPTAVGGGVQSAQPSVSPATPASRTGTARAGTEPPAQPRRPRASRRGRIVTVVAAVLAVLVVGWLILGRGDGSGFVSPSAPPAPASDQLTSGDWLLERYSLNNVGGDLQVEGTVRNRGAASASADLRVWVYSGQESLGSVTAAVTDVPAGQVVSVSMSGDATWASGHKTVLLEASPR